MTVARQASGIYPHAGGTRPAIATKEADLHLAHVTAMQEIRKVLTPEQQQQFKTLQGRMMHEGRREHQGRREHHERD